MATTTKNSSGLGSGNSARRRRSQIRSGNAYSGPRRQMRGRTPHVDNIFEQPDSDSPEDGYDTPFDSDGSDDSSAPSPWHTNVGDEPSHNAPLTPSAANDSKKKTLDSDDISKREKDGASSATPPVSGSETPLLNKDTPFSYKGKGPNKALQATPVGRFAMVMQAMRNNKGKTAAGGGAAGVGITVLFAMFAGGLAPINIMERFTNFGNLEPNFTSKNRMARSTARYLSAFTEAGRSNLRATAFFKDFDKINTTKMLGKLEKAGFAVARDEAGNITTISKKLSNGNVEVLNAAASNASEESARFIRAIGAEGVQDLEKATLSRIGRTTGPNGRTFLGKRLQSGLDSYINKTRGDPTKTEAANARDTVTDMTTPETDAEIRTGGTGDPATTTDEQGVVRDPETGQPINQETPPTDIDKTIKEVGEQVSTTEADTVEKTVLASKATTAEDVATGFKNSIDGIGATVAASTVLSAVNATQWMSVLCSAIGTMQYVASMRNILFVTEAARFGFRYLNAAASQKAGIAITDGIPLMQKFFTTGGGGSYVGAPGLLYAMGDKSHPVSEESRSKLSGGRENTGAIGRVDSYFSSLPGFNSTARTATCKTVNNGWFQVGSIAVTLGITALTLGSGAGFSFSANALITGGIQAGLQIALAVAAPRLVQAGAHRMISDLKTSLQKGDGLGMGLLAFKQMSTNNDVMLITPKSVAPAVRASALEDYKIAMRSQSLKDRYFSTNNGRSLLATASLKTIPTARTALFNPFSMPQNMIASGVEAITGGQATYAAAITSPTEQCTDPALKDYATDPFCNSENSLAPNLDIDQTYNLLLANGHITEDGTPSSDDFKDFINRCASGQPTLVYNTDVKTDGSSTSLEDRCIDDKDVLIGEDKTIAQAYDYIYENQPKQNFFAKLLGAKTYAAPGDNMPVSTRMRFAAWYGYQVDTSKLVDMMSNEPVEADSTAPQAANNNIFVLGDSLTAGMQKLDNSNNYLGSQLATAGYTATIDAQGCRGVYQPTGDIIGNGTNCPTGTIIDGLKAVATPANQAALQRAAGGTVLIMLGTNGTETNSVEFKTKAGELIDNIRTVTGTGTRIAWLNVRLKTNGQKQTAYNQALNELRSEKSIELFDWDSYVTTANSDASQANNVTWPTNDGTHHDANGYRQKAAYILNTLGPAPTSANAGSGGISGDVNCTNPSGNVKIICAAIQYQGIRYAFTTVKQMKDKYNLTFTSIPGGMMRGGANAEVWLKNRVVGSNTDFVDCSGFANLSMYVAFGYKTTSTCSGFYVRDVNGDGYSDADKNIKIVPLDQIQPGDFLTVSQDCQTSTSKGHIAIYVGKESNGHYRTLESSAGKNVNGEIKTGFYDRAPNFFLYAARYVGPGSNQ